MKNSMIHTRTTRRRGGTTPLDLFLADLAASTPCQVPYKSTKIEELSPTPESLFTVKPDNCTGHRIDRSPPSQRKSRRRLDDQNIGTRRQSLPRSVDDHGSKERWTLVCSPLQFNKTREKEDHELHTSKKSQSVDRWNNSSHERSSSSTIDARNSGPMIRKPQRNFDEENDKGCLTMHPCKVASRGYLCASTETRHKVHLPSSASRRRTVKASEIS